MDVEVVAIDAGSPAASWALGEYFAELDVRFPGGFDPGDAPATAHVDLNPPNGLFLIAQHGAETLACGGLQHVDSTTTEVKRMWVSPAARGLGLGRRLLRALEDAAVECGRSRVVLDTNGTLTQAIAMYRSAGYVEIGRYNDNPYAQLWFAKDLLPPRGATTQT